MENIEEKDSAEQPAKADSQEQLGSKPESESQLKGDEKKDVEQVTEKVDPVEKTEASQKPPKKQNTEKSLNRSETYDKTKIELVQLYKRTTQLNELLKSTQTEYESYKSKSEEKLEILTERNASLQSYCEKLDKKYNQANTLYLNKEYDIRMLKEDNARIANENEIFKENIQQLLIERQRQEDCSKELSELRAFKAESQKQNQAIVIKELTNQNGQFKKQIELLQSDIAKLEQDNQHMFRFSEDR